MNLLETQAQFEQLWFYSEGNPKPEGMRRTDNAFIVYFTAAWCKPCQKLDCDLLAAYAALQGLTIFKCDATVNDYTSGYCQIRAFPTFVLYRPRQEVLRFQSNNTEAVKDWLQSL